MASMWMPTWLNVAWAIAFGVALLVHVRHMAAVTGYGRLWHGVHMLMAAGMIVMIAPGGMDVVPSGLGVLVFAAAAAAPAGVLFARSARRHAALWVIAIVDLAAMAYMFGMMSIRTVWLTVPLVAWFGAEAAGWATGRLAMLGETDARRVLHAARDSATRPVVAAAVRTPLAGTVGAPALGERPPSSRCSAALVGRVTLAITALGMAYMLAVMQFGHVG